MSGRQIRQGFLHEESKDDGISMLSKVVADGKPMDVEIIGTMGIEGAPLKGCRVLIFCCDDDDGKAIGIAFPAPADRTDKKKPGELVLKNHKNGSTTKFGDDGTITTQAKKDGNLLADGKVNLGKLNGYAVLTVAGPSSKVFGVV